MSKRADSTRAGLAWAWSWEARAERQRQNGEERERRTGRRRTRRWLSWGLLVVPSLRNTPDRRERLTGTTARAPVRPASGRSWPRGRGRVGAADVLGRDALGIDHLGVGRALVHPRQGDPVLEQPDELVEAGPEPGAELAPVGGVGERVPLLVAPGVVAGLEDLDVDLVPSWAWGAEAAVAPAPEAPSPGRRTARPRRRMPPRRSRPCRRNPFCSWSSAPFSRPFGNHYCTEHARPPSLITCFFRGADPMPVSRPPRLFRERKEAYNGAKDS